MGRKKEKVEGLHPEGKTGHRFLLSGRRRGGGEASRLAENPGEDFHWLGGGVESPRGNDTPRVEAFPRGGATSRVTLEGDKVPGTDGRERGGGRNSAFTLETEGSTATCRRREMASEPDPAATPSTLWGTEEGESVG